jgi:hypothetical protein
LFEKDLDFDGGSEDSNRNGYDIDNLPFYVLLKNTSLICSALRAFEQGGIFIVPHLL